MDNSLVTPGATSVLGVPVDLSRIEVDTYLWTGSDFIRGGSEAFEHEEGGWRRLDGHGPH